MINLLLLLFFLTCIGVTAAWIAENPGSVTIHWFDYRIDTSFAFLLVLALLSALLLAYAYIVLRHISLVPERHGKRRSLRQYEKGLSELTYSVAALASADLSDAAAHTKKAEKLLGQTPLTLLLSAQISRSQGNDEQTRSLLAQMLEHKETEYLASRFLSDNATRQQLFPKALALAQRAHAVNPKGIVPLLSLHVRLGQWQQAMQVVDKSLRKGAITRAQLRHYKGIVAYGQGMQLLESGYEHGALAAARQCLKAQGDFVPFVAFAARSYSACGKQSKALKLLYKAWKTTPHPDLAEALRHITARESRDTQMKAVLKLASYNPAASESDIAVAQTAIAQKDWLTARKSLSTALAKSETVRVCTLLAEVEKGEYPGFDIGSKWITRSAKAAIDPAWVCNSCGRETEHWHAHCPACESFDTLNWKKRDMRFAG